MAPVRHRPRPNRYRSMSKEEIIRFIEEVFDGVEQPKEITLYVAEAHDGYDYDNDSLHRKKDFVGRWQDVPREHMHECQFALCHLDKFGMRYYLPAYMVWYLRHLEDSDEVNHESPLYQLDHHPKQPSLSEYFKERFSLFNSEQMKACALFIQYCAASSNGYSDEAFARKKFDRFWYQYI